MSYSVTLVTSPGCHYCGHAREVLERVAADVSLEIVEVDHASPDGAAAQQRWRAPYPPLVLIEGQLFGYGRISERKLRKALSVERSR